MTRINLIDPQDLTDQHLVAEYRELPRVFTLAQQWLDRGKPGDIPPTYRMGAGHVRFFYDKTDYLSKRQALLIAECQRRGFDIAHVQAPAPIEGATSGWLPDVLALTRNLRRLLDKVEAKPNFYRYYGSTLTFNPYKVAFITATLELP